MEREDRSTAAGASLPRGQCQADDCTQRVRRGCFKYCGTHSPQASRLWKQRTRKEAAQRGERPWLDYWRSLTGSEEAARLAYNAWMRAYMREWRVKRRLASKTGEPIRSAA